MSSNFKEIGSQLRPLTELTGFIYFSRIDINVTKGVVGGGFPDAPHICNCFR